MGEILYKVEEGIATLTICCPEVLNALGSEKLVELTDLFKRAEADENVLCVVVNANGEKAFCVGGDIKEEVNMGGYLASEFSAKGQNLVRTIRNLRVPVIIAAHGYVLGAGMEMVLASDFTFVSHDAKLALPSINIGSINGFGGSQLLPRLIGPMRAKEILMSGRHIPAQEAVALGLALKAVDRSDLMNETYAFARMLTGKAPFALRCLKIAVNKALETDVETGFLLESQMFARVQASEDKREAMEAFLAKRPPATFVNR